MAQFKLSIEKREKLSYIFLIILFLTLLVGLFKLQIVEHTQLAKQSENNRIRVESIIPRRGIVTDRNGQIIIDNRPSYTVSVVPVEIVKGKTIENLSELIALDTSLIEIKGRY